nr:unnamed protein product [Leishmania braziliensis]
MNSPSQVTADPTFSSPHPSALSAGTPIPWLPLPPPSSAGSSAMIASDASERWAAALQSVPYLHSILEGPTFTVYRPPTVIQLSEATGCSVSKLAGAYSDLPVITLTKIVSTGYQEKAAPEAAALSLNSDAFEYLQLSPTDDSLEMAAKALMARRPVPDAEEIFWEAEYWETLSRVRRQAQEEKEGLREKKRAQRERRAMMGASNSSVGVPSSRMGAATTQSSMNSPSFATPHSRQGSLGGPPGDCGDGSPANLHIQTAAQRTAKGLLRRARYNEAHNPAQRMLVRSGSLLSQSSATQSVVRCRTRPRHDSITSLHTLSGARGFQYPLSSFASDDGRSATSDSFRTLPTHIGRSCPSRELLATSLELELSASGEPANTDTTIRVGPASAEGAKVDTAATPEVSPPQNDGGSPIASQEVTKKRPPSALAAASLHSLSSMQALSNHSPGCRRRRSTNSLIRTSTTSPKTWAMVRNSVTHAPPTNPTPMPLSEPLALERTPPSPLRGRSNRKNKDTSLSPRPAGAKCRRVGKKRPEAEGESEECGGASGLQPQLLSLSKMHRRSGGQSLTGVSPAPVDAQPNSRCTTARPSSGTINRSATASPCSRPSGGTPRKSPQTAPVTTAAVGASKIKSSFAAPSRVAREATVKASTSSVGAPSTAADAKVKKGGVKKVATKADLKLMSLHPNTAQPLPGCRVDGDSVPAKDLSHPSMPPRTAAVTATASSALPHLSLSSSILQKARVPLAPVPMPPPQAGPAAMPSAITTISAVTTPSPNSTTPRRTETTVPSSRAPTREVTLSLHFEQAAVDMRATSPAASKGGAATASSTTSRMTVAPPTAPKPSSTVATPRRNGEVPLASDHHTTATTSESSAKGEAATPPAVVSDTASEDDAVPAQLGNDRADESATVPPSSSLTLPTAPVAGRDARSASQGGAVAGSGPSKNEVKKKASSCCAVA